MIYDELPIFKSTLDFVVYIETIVKGFDKYHKYTIGVVDCFTAFAMTAFLSLREAKRRSNPKDITNSKQQ